MKNRLLIVLKPKAKNTSTSCVGQASRCDTMFDRRYFVGMRPYDCIVRLFISDKPLLVPQNSSVIFGVFSSFSADFAMRNGSETLHKRLDKR